MLDVVRTVDDIAGRMSREHLADVAACLHHHAKLLLCTDDGEKSKAVSGIFGLLYNHEYGRGLDPYEVAEATTALLQEYTKTLRAETNAGKAEAVTGFFNLLRCHENGLQLNSRSLVEAAIAAHQYLPEGSHKGYVALAVIPKHTDNIPPDEAVAAANFAADRSDCFFWDWKIRLAGYTPTQAEKDFHKDLQRVTMADRIKQEARRAEQHFHKSGPVPESPTPPARPVVIYSAGTQRFDVA